MSAPLRRESADIRRHPHLYSIGISHVIRALPNAITGRRAFKGRALLSSESRQIPRNQKMGQS